LNSKKLILRNASEINRLKALMDESFKNRHETSVSNQIWEEACQNFHDQYDRLAFPGGLEGAYTRILDGDPYAMEAAIVFVECRPFFFRSGYMYCDIIKKLKRSPLSNELKQRFEKVMESYEQYRCKKNLDGKPNFDDSI